MPRRPAWTRLQVALDLARVLPTVATAIIGLRCRGLNTTAHALGVPLDFGADSPVPSTEPSRPGLSASEKRRAQLITVVIRRLYGRQGCLRQSLALGHLLRRHDAVVRIGVRAGSAQADVHAWVEVNGTPVGRGQGFAPLRRPA